MTWESLRRQLWNFPKAFIQDFRLISSETQKLVIISEFSLFSLIEKLEFLLSIEFSWFLLSFFFDLFAEFFWKFNSFMMNFFESNRKSLGFQWKKLLGFDNFYGPLGFKRIWKQTNSLFICWSLSGVWIYRKSIDLKVKCIFFFENREKISV